MKALTDVRVVNFHVEETVRGYGRNGIPETALPDGAWVLWLGGKMAASGTINPREASS